MAFPSISCRSNRANGLAGHATPSRLLSSSILVSSGDGRTRQTGPTALTSLRSGIFIAPFHPTDEDPTLAVRRDLELIGRLDRLGYEEAWMASTTRPGTSSSPRPNYSSLPLPNAREGSTRRAMPPRGVPS